VTVSPTTVSLVTFTDTIDPGWVEVCKNATTVLSGTFNFNVTGAFGFKALNVPVNVGGCSNPIEMPAGTVTVTEAGTNLYVTSLTATSGVGARTVNQLLSANLITGTATVNVNASNDPSVQTDVFYSNNVVEFKVCKAWDAASGPEPGGAATVFTFALTYSGAPGPNVGPASVSTTAGNCSTPFPLRAGTMVGITEGIVPGSKVEAITTDTVPAESIVPASLSLANRTVAIIVGTPVTSSTGPGNEAIVTFLDRTADPGWLKICKIAGTTPGAPITTVNSGIFTFTTVASGVSYATNVAVGQCAFVVDATGSRVLFPFNLTVSVTETASAGNIVSAITSMPSPFVTLNSGATVSNEPVLTSTVIGISAGSTNLTISENVVNELDVTNVDPPAITLPPVSPVTILGGPTVVLPVATQPSANVSTVVSDAGQSTVSLSSGLHLTVAQRKAEVKALQKSLSRVELSITRGKEAVAHLKGSARRSELKRIATWKNQERILKQEIRALR
jgi:hypothetical protein